MNTPPLRRPGLARAGALALLALASLAGCATPRSAPARSDVLRLTSAEVQLVHDGGPDSRQVERALDAALPEVVRRWGPLSRRVRIEILPDHASLEAAVDRPGYPWLRAWARFDGIWLQAPSTWERLAGTDEAVRELLVHELTHVAMYQRAAGPEDWQQRRIPLWFREGMASVTARQAYRRQGLEELATWLRANPDVDPLAAHDELYRDAAGTVYGAAHHAYVFLESRYGVDAVRALLDRMQRSGERFPEAFEAAFGLPLARFEAEFRRYVVWEGWRRAGLTPRPPKDSTAPADARSPSPSAAAPAP